MKFAISQRTERIMSRHSIILGYYIVFVKFVGNRNKLIYYYNLNKSWEVSSSKCTQKKLIASTILNFQKIKEELGDLFGSKNPTRGKYTCNRALNY